MIISNKHKFIIAVGFLLLFSILILNQYILEKYFTPDGIINSNDKLFIIWIYDISALIIGSIIIYQRGKIKITLKNILIVFSQIIVSFILLEGSLRLYYTIVHYFNPVKMTFSEQIGWQTDPFISITEHSDRYGTIKFSTQKYGFKIFGDVDTQKTKIFVIGDSFTMGAIDGGDKTYYDYLLKNNSNIEIFAYGAGGYGSLQEYMILDKYIDEINPDIILWQFCDNDFINNDHELESRSILNGALDPRPYYVNDKIKVMKPWRRHGIIYDFLHRLYFVQLASLEIRILEKDNLVTIEKELTQEHPLYLNSVHTTEKIMKLCKNRIGDKPLITFNAKMYDEFPGWWSDAFEKIAMKNNFIFLSQITDSLTAARDSGIKIDGTPKNEHWNSTGHAIVGKLLLNYLISNKLIKSKN